MSRYFDTRDLLKKYPKARYFYVIAGRSVGKTYPTIKLAIEDAIDGKGVFGYLRRYKETISERNMLALMSPHNAWISQKTNGDWNRIGYWRRNFYLEKWEEASPDNWIRVARRPTPIGAVWSLNTWENDKGPDYGADKGGFAHIILDEAKSKGGDYLKDEWDTYQNVIATLIRDRWEQDTKLWLLCNPVSKYNDPYTRNLGITKKMQQKPGTTFIEYPNEKSKKSLMSCVYCYIAQTDGGDIDENRTNLYNRFFAFPNSKGKSQSITHGFWEMDDANTLPSGVYKESTKNRTIFLTFGEELLAVDVMRYDPTGIYYLFLYPTDRIRDKCYFITLGMTLSKYGIIGLKTGHPIADLINRIYKTGQVYYADNMTADVFHGFLKEAGNRRI